MTEAAMVKIDLYEYLEKCGGSDTLRFDFVPGKTVDQFDAARNYAHKLREKLTSLLGEAACPDIVAKGNRVIITLPQGSLDEVGAPCAK
jgi:hypothetical protein